MHRFHILPFMSCGNIICESVRKINPIKINNLRLSLCEAASFLFQQPKRAVVILHSKYRGAFGGIAISLMVAD